MCHAVIQQCVIPWCRNICLLPDRLGEIHARDVTILAVRGVDIYRISFGVGQYADFLAAF